MVEMIVLTEKSHCNGSSYGVRSRMHEQNIYARKRIEQTHELRQLVNASLQRNCLQQEVILI